MFRLTRRGSQLAPAEWFDDTRFQRMMWIVTASPGDVILWADAHDLVLRYFPFIRPGFVFQRESSCWLRGLELIFIYWPAR